MQTEKLHFEQKIKWEIYDPSWIIKIAEKQIPEETDLINNIKRCVKCFKESKAYYYFVYSKFPNTTSSEWQFERNILIKHKKKGEIVLDVLKNNKLGGIEFLKRL